MTSLFLAATAFAQKIDSAIMPKGGGAHYEPEYTLDRTVNPAAWTKEKTGLHISFASTDQLYFRTEVPDLEDLSWTATGWKGERLNAQLLVWSADTLKQVRFVVSDLRNAQGKVLGKENIQLDKVMYVLSNYPYNAKGFDCGPTPYKDGFLMPDRFEHFGRFDLPGKTVRPIWLRCNIPADAEAGTYSGTIEVRTAGAGQAVLNIRLIVQKQVLPKPHDWHHRLDLWQNPWVISQYYHVQPWGEEHKALLKKHLQLYADAGGTFITTYGVHSPWAGNEYVVEDGMIEWIKRKNGSWRFDYTIFDQYVELAMSVGIDKAITIYTPVPWENRFRYMNEATGDYVYETWAPDTKVFTETWNAFLDDLKEHLKRKGWLNKTYIGINENPLEQTLAAARTVKKNWSGWKITYAGNWHPELDTLIDDYCFLYGNESSVEQVRARTLRNSTTTYYICCNPAKPNTFVFSPPIEARWLGWYTAAHGYSGFLRWAYDAWPSDPVRDARFGSWAAGDCYLVYPGGNSCIRYEKLREGIVDYEKIRIVKDKAAKSTDKTVRQLLLQLNDQLKIFLNEKDFDPAKITNDVEKGRMILNKLSDLL
ncbi:MAG TPA: glycoside hydrolase domain-containing protein [Puia sp.]|nr:glycoside hydrolase domain-containing protein [Puia sp.]